MLANPSSINRETIFWHEQQSDLKTEQRDIFPRGSVHLMPGDEISGALRKPSPPATSYRRHFQAGRRRRYRRSGSHGRSCSDLHAVPRKGLRCDGAMWCGAVCNRQHADAPKFGNAAWLARLGEPAQIWQCALRFWCPGAAVLTLQAWMIVQSWSFVWEVHEFLVNKWRVEPW